MRNTCAFLLCALLLGLPLAAPAATGGAYAAGSEKTQEMDHHGGHEHAQHDHAGAPAAEAVPGSALPIGSQTRKGIIGTASIGSAAQGTTAPRYFRIAFADEATGQAVSTGTVVLKVTDPDAKVALPVVLNAAEGAFGLDLAFAMQGEYHFRLDTLLADGVQRKYHFHHVNR